MNFTQASVVITGKVQGVGYRYWTVAQARKLGLTGWVKNLPDGRVEAVFEGEQSAIEQMIQACYTGPTAAMVSDVNVEMSEPNALEGFEILN